MRRFLAAVVLLLICCGSGHAAELVCHVVEVDFTLPDLRVEVRCRHKNNNQLFNHTFTPSNGAVTSANFVASMKTLLINMALARYGVTIVATDILIIGAPQ